MLELFPQHKANRLDELDALETVRKIKQFHVTDIVKIRHPTHPERAPRVARAKDVDEKVETRNDLNDIVHREKGPHLIGLSPLHESRTMKYPSAVARAKAEQNSPGAYTKNDQINTANNHRRPHGRHEGELVGVEGALWLVEVLHASKDVE